MALSLGVKINRFLYFTRQLFQNIRQPYSKNSKPRCKNPDIKSASTLTKNQSNSKPIKPNEEYIYATQNNFQGINSAAIPLLTSDLDNPSVTIRRKFAKSSTQNAITRPLKMPRLANPFPEPVKTLQSETVSDDEKARLMHEQVKMEARFHLQMHQEKLLKYKMQKSIAEEETFPSEQETNYPYSQEEANYQIPQQDEESYQQSYNSFPQHQQQHYNEDLYQQPNYPSRQGQQNLKQQSNYRKPKDYKDLMQDEQEKKINQQQEQMQQLQRKQQLMQAAKKDGVNSTENTSEDLDNRRPPSSQCRKRRNTRSARNLRHSWYPRHVRKQISRQYSTSPTIDPEIISQSEKCDRLIKHLKSLYPTYQNLKKPLLVPGSEEERQFMKKVMKQIARHKSMNNPTNKTEAPFPSYSEINTYRHDNDYKTAKVTNNNKNTSRYDNDYKTAEVTNNNNKNTSRYHNDYKTAEVTNNKFSRGSHRSYSTKKQSINDKILLKPVNKVIPKFSYQGKSVIFPPINKPGLQKQEAPYPSYSEGQDNPSGVISAARSFGINNLLRSKPDNKYHYSTSTNDTTEKVAKKKPPCKNPFPPIPECDYEATIRKKEEKKRKKHCPKNKKCSPDNEDIDSYMIISKIKTWLSAYRTGADNIKISRSEEDIDGRETYVIEVNELEEIKPGDPEMLLIEEQQNAPEIVEIIQPYDSKSVFPGRIGRKLPFKNMEYHSTGSIETYSPEMIDQIPVFTKNIPEFTSPAIEKTFNPVIEASERKSKNYKLVDVQHKCNKLEIQKKDYEPEVKMRDNKTEFKSKDIIPVEVKQKQYIPEVLQKDYKSEVKKIEDILGLKPKETKFESVASADEEVEVEENDTVYYSSKSTEIEDMDEIKEQIKEDQVNRVKKFLASEQEAEKIKKKAEVNKIKDFTTAKQQYEKAQIKTKEDRINKTVDIFIPKKIEKKVITSKGSFKHKQTSLTAEDAMATKEEITQNRSCKTLPQPSKMNRLFSDFKDLDEFCPVSLPEPCPVFTRKLGSPKSKEGEDCDNKYIKDGCKNQRKEDECPPKKCRFRKKRKIPSCDDVKGNKNCLPIYNYIPGLENNPQFALDPPKKTYFRNSNNITQYINLKSDDIDMLAKQDNISKEDEFVPFKLKPQFWKH